MPLKCSSNAQCFCLSKMLEKMLAYCSKAYTGLLPAGSLCSSALARVTQGHSEVNLLAGYKQHEQGCK